MSSWKTISGRIVYSNPWMTVREDQVLMPNGEPGIYGVVSPTSISASVIALTDLLEVHLVGQHRYPTQEYSWEIVAGGTNSEETPLDAAKRELSEELGLSASLWHGLGEVHFSNSMTDERGFLFVAQGLESIEGSHPDPTEILDHRIVSLQEAVSMVESGGIKDASSIIAILRIALLNSRGAFALTKSPQRS